MGFDLESAKLAIPQGLSLLPGETIEFIAKTCAIKLFEATADGGFKECDDGIGEFYGQSDGAANESTVLITNYRTCYRPVRNSSTTSLHPQIDLMRSTTQIPHLSISQIEESQAQITITLKFSPSKYLFKFSKPKPTALVGNFINIRTTANSLCHDFTTIMKRFVYPSSLENTFAFHMGEAEVFKKNDQIKRDQNIQRIRKLSLEEKIFEELFGEKAWMNLFSNEPVIWAGLKDFSISPTYPQDFILPTQVLKETLANLNSSSTCSNLSNTSLESQPTAGSQTTSESQSGSSFFENLAKFRSRGRFPVICWKKGHNVLMRSGQPMVGFLGSRGFEDETLMREVLSTVDEEHQILATTIIRKGYDGDEFNNHRFSKHYGGFYEPCGMKLCVLDARGYAAALSNGYQGGGYENIDGVVGKLVDEDASVLVGLQVLIEKEWIAFGHPFRSRSELPNNLCNSDPRLHSKNKQTSRNFKEPQNLPPAPAPVFLLFLTCLHHILEQFPSAFEYNDFFLLCLARAAAGNSPFGDFLCNSECEREAIQLRERTRSIWSWVKERRQWFRNPLYQRIRPYDLIHHNDHSTWSDHSWKKDVLRPDTDARVITLWTDYYFPKNDLSIALLSTPYGADVELEEGIGPSQHRIGGFPSEYYLVSLFMKRKRRRIAEKVWTVWRSFLLENRQKSLKTKKEKKKVVSDEEKWDVLHGSEWKDDAPNQSQDVQDRTSMDHVNKDLDKNSILSSSLQSTCEQLNNLLSTDFDDDIEESEDDTNIILSGEICESQFLEWVHLSSQGSEDSETTRILAELLKEAQLDGLLSQSICQDNESLTELLKEAQSENQVFCQNVHSDTETLTELLKEAQLDNHYLCRSRCSNTSSINRNSTSTNLTFKTPINPNLHSIIIENNKSPDEKDFVGIVSSPEPLKPINKSSPDLSEFEFVIV
ncbi:18448_t:CDS:2 [Racocetra fulgida]|uniref:18448_t:CDS:1 n=1 Tax=Racocetra fulgida TaxID=60492 RepID=A0A9N8VF12_9GLOM|nr:18448_t:CDS:2 [Racocetra fulgida]